MIRGTEYAEHFREFSGDHVYVTPNIPQEKLHRALASYGSRIVPEEIILLYDDTVFGGAEEGFILTRNYIFFKEIFESPCAYVICDNLTYSVKKGVINKLFMVDGEKVFVITQMPFEKAYRLTERINQLAQRKLDKKKTEEQKASVNTLPPKKKKCPYCAEEINAEAIKCRFCGEMLNSTTTTANAQKVIGETDDFLVKELLNFAEFPSPDGLKNLTSQYGKDALVSAIGEICRRALEERDIDAGVAWVTLEFVMNSEEMDEEVRRTSGTVLGVAAARGHSRAKTMLGQFYQSYRNGAISQDKKEFLFPILDAAAKKCSLDACL